MFQFKVVQSLPISLEKAWDFFASPANLSLITPKELALVPISEVPSKMYAGMIIRYKVRPVAGLPMLWVTEITKVREGEFFVDEQRLGPYRFWHHQHHFKAVTGGVEMTDIVHYRLPFGALGNALGKGFVGKKLQFIFDYRRERLEEVFGQ